MNKTKWEDKIGKQAHAKWLAKLGEEMGEVSKAYNENLMEGDWQHMLEELDHVIFIAGCWERQIKMWAEDSSRDVKNG